MKIALDLTSNNQTSFDRINSIMLAWSLFVALCELLRTSKESLIKSPERSSAAIPHATGAAW
jgi:hypothetical protein